MIGQAFVFLFVSRNTEQIQRNQQSPEQKHNAVHFSAAFVHLQCVVQPFLQLQWISSWQDFAASGRVVHRGCHPDVSLVQPHSDGSSSLGSETSDWFQMSAW